MMKYLTRPKDPKKIAKVEREDKYIVDGSKGTIRSEREIKEEEINKDPNLLRRIKYYNETYDKFSLGKEFDTEIAAEDKNLAALGRAPQNILQRGKKIDGIKKRLENSRAYGYDPKNDKPFTKIANNLGKKKLTKSIIKEMPLPKVMPIDPTPYIAARTIPEDPKLKELERKVFADQKKSQEEKNKGLPSILGIKV